MRVGLLMYGLDRPLSGVTRVALELGRALQRRSDIEVVYLTTYDRGPFRDDPDCVTWQLPGCSLLPAVMTLGGPMIAYAARKLGLDVVHDPIGVAPFPIPRHLAPFKRIVTIHDAIAYRYPDGYPWLNNFLHRSYLPRMLSNVDSVITTSHDAAADLHRFLGLPEDELSVVYSGVNEHFSIEGACPTDEELQAYGIRCPYVLTVSAQQPRKNLDGLLAAFTMLHQRFPEYQLVVAGPSLFQNGGNVGNWVDALRPENAVVFPGYIPEEELPGLYRAASLFVFPSLYEGYGLPVLEAMACGTPVVCSSTSSLPEVAGGAALLVDPRSASAIAEGMASVLERPELRQELVEKGEKRASQLTWDRAAQSVVDVYERALAGRWAVR